MEMKLREERRIRWRQAGSVLLILFGNFLYALTVQLFLTPVDLVTGGVTGMSIALSEVTGHSVSGFVFVCNMILLLVGWIFLGRRFALSTILSTVAYPVFLGFWEMMLGDVILTDNMMLCAVFSGLGIGISLGIVLREGASTGGMDIPPLILNKFFRIPVSVSMYAFDFVILLAQILVFPAENLLYGITGILIYTIVLDKMLMLGSSKTEVKIVSGRSDEIQRAILKEADRGVTVLHGAGGYTGHASEILLSIISNRELPIVEKLVHNIDPEAFMVVMRVSEVSGHGFTMKKEYR